MSQEPEKKFFSTAISRWFFGISTFLMLYLAYLLIQPFLMPIFLAVVLVVVGWPLHQGVLWVVGAKRQYLAAAIMVLLFCLIIVLPLYFMMGIITDQALDLYNTVSRMVQGGGFHDSLKHGLDLLNPFFDKLNEALGISKTDVFTQVGELVRRVSNLLYSNLAGLLRGITNLVIDFFLMLIVAFYLFIDGRRAADRILSLSPMPSTLNNQIKDEVLNTMRATLTGTVVLSLLQGILGGIGFWIFGVPNSPFWGTVMVFASVVPIFGTAVVWVPGGLFLLLSGMTGAGVGVMVWCLISALICDNLIRPKLLGNVTHLHPLMVFFAVLGGLLLFGVVGLVLGPMVLALMLSLLEVYRLHFVPNEIEAVDCAPPPPAPETGPADPHQEN
ncbi:MAG: AI-2E family transporter [Proteobacteria bacterium]|nr:AI-2E family transporter [Pseudomonadota bacterium]MBU4382316.1 AI-2E family transporter [Pseudomonadota bacterium]MCG2765980.1 AI-2E family transporter [Desulfarculaceae bacterium]